MFCSIKIYISYLRLKRAAINTERQFLLVEACHGRSIVAIYCSDSFVMQALKP